MARVKKSHKRLPHGSKPAYFQKNGAKFAVANDGYGKTVFRRSGGRWHKHYGFQRTMKNIVGAVRKGAGWAAKNAGNLTKVASMIAA